MRTLQEIKATPEQLPFISDASAGIMVVRGAAGSGKTTTAILRLRALLKAFENRRVRLGHRDPVRALVLTYNKTLRGYIADLVDKQRVGAKDPAAVQFHVSTFGKWSFNRLGRPNIVQPRERVAIIKSLGSQIPLTGNFLVEEVDYALGRFLPDDLDEYLTARRAGRGDTPRVDGPIRAAILNDVIENYSGWKEANDLQDFNDLAVELALKKVDPLYDIIIADECQDFSGNQLRAAQNHLKDAHSFTIVIDSTQRIYPRGFASWNELGISVRPDNVKTLKVNYRNTRQIAALALPLVEGLTHDENASLPDFTKTKREGETPVVLAGRFSRQTAWAMDYIKTHVDLTKESVAFLHPLGGNWFRHVWESLDAEGLEYVTLTRESEWPEGEQSIALCTCHSAKGLEFDHVFILGLNEECLPAARDDEDRLHLLRRLIAMSIGRARNFVCLGYKPDEKSGILDILKDGTYELIAL